MGKSHINSDITCIITCLGFICLGTMLHKYIWSSGFIVASWIALIVGSCSYKREKVNPLSIENTTALRGVCALEILLGHVGLFNNNPFCLQIEKREFWL